MDTIQGGGSFSVCPDTGAVTRSPDSTRPEGAPQEPPQASPVPAASSGPTPAPKGPKTAKAKE